MATWEEVPSIALELQPAELRELIVEAWLARAPKRRADRYVAEHF